NNIREDGTQLNSIDFSLEIDTDVLPQCFGSCWLRFDNSVELLVGTKIIYNDLNDDITDAEEGKVTFRIEVESNSLATSKDQKSIYPEKETFCLNNYMNQLQYQLNRSFGNNSHNLGLKKLCDPQNGTSINIECNILVKKMTSDIALPVSLACKIALENTPIVFPNCISQQYSIDDRGSAGNPLCCLNTEYAPLLVTVCLFGSTHIVLPSMKEMSASDGYIVFGLNSQLRADNFECQFVRKVTLQYPDILNIKSKAEKYMEECMRRVSRYIERVDNKFCIV
ncbi:MAG: Exosome complex component RRP42, partial [Marteilia pararefringens]